MVSKPPGFGSFYDSEIQKGSLHEQNERFYTLVQSKHSKGKHIVRYTFNNAKKAIMSKEINSLFEQLATVHKRLGIQGNEEETELSRKRWKLFHVIIFALFYILLVLCAVMSYIKDESLFAAQVVIAAIIHRTDLPALGKGKSFNISARLYY